MQNGTMTEAGVLTAAAPYKTNAELLAGEKENIARVCHEANRAICIINGDLSQPSWDDAPDWQKKSAIDGVQFHLNNPHAEAQRSHDQWMEGKLRDGWRYGPTKNADTKEHPCLLPYHALPENEKVKDQIFSAIVRGYTTAYRQRPQPLPGLAPESL